MKSMRKYVAIASAIAMLVTGINEVTGNNKVMADDKPIKAILLDEKDIDETYYKATVNIFDYNSLNTWEGYNVYGLKTGYGKEPSYWLKNCGVNLDIRKQFAESATDRSKDDSLFLFGGERHKYKNQAEYNEWTGAKGGVFQGLVKNQLASDGSLEFSDGVNCIDLFPSSSEKYEHIKPYYNSEFLFQKRDGYYTFDSDNDKICSVVSGGALQLEFDFEEKGPVFDTTTGTNNRNYGFFPLNSNDDNVEEYKEKRHHMFGMEMSIDFNVNQTRTVNGEDMVFTFSGDDDVWVFIDDRLVLDLGGIHNKATGSINFKTGSIDYSSDSYPIKTYTNSTEIVTSGSAVSGTAVTSKVLSSKKVVSLEEALGKKITTGKHTLKLFYLERGESDSNCMINFNLDVEETVIPSPTPVETSKPTGTPTAPVKTSEPTGTPTVPAKTSKPTGTPTTVRTGEPPKTSTPVRTSVPTTTPTPKVSDKPPVFVTSMPKETEKAVVTTVPEKTEVPTPTGVVITKEPIPEATVAPAIEVTSVPTTNPTATPWIAEKTMVPNVPKPTESVQQTENPVEVPSDDIPEGAISTVTPTTTVDSTSAPDVEATEKPDVEATEKPDVTTEVTNKVEIVDETEKPAAPVKVDTDDDVDDTEDDEKNKKDKEKTTIIIDDQTPGNLPKTGGIASVMENSRAASCTVIAFLLGSVVIFFVGKLKGKRIKK